MHAHNHWQCMYIFIIAMCIHSYTQTGMHTWFCLYIVMQDLTHNSLVCMHCNDLVMHTHMYMLMHAHIYTFVSFINACIQQLLLLACIVSFFNHLSKQALIQACLHWQLHTTDHFCIHVCIWCMHEFINAFIQAYVQLKERCWQASLVHHWKNFVKYIAKKRTIQFHEEWRHITHLEKMVVNYKICYLGKTI